MLSGIKYLLAKNPITISKSFSKIYFLMMYCISFFLSKQTFGLFVNNKAIYRTTSD